MAFTFVLRYAPLSSNDFFSERSEMKFQPRDALVLITVSAICGHAPVGLSIVDVPGGN